MKSKIERLEDFLKEVEDEYGTEVSEECRRRLLSRPPGKGVEPYKILKEVRSKFLKKTHDSIVRHSLLRCTS